MMDLVKSCDICGDNMSVEGVEMPSVELIMDIWARNHKHSEMELRMYHDSELAYRQYQHSHAFGAIGGDIDDIDPDDISTSD